ncbi:hypothetical protein SANTM175S_09690 [Streptomyces antimycoticus]
MPFSPSGTADCSPCGSPRCWPWPPPRPGSACSATGSPGPRAGLAAGLVSPLFPAVQRYAPEGRSYALVCAAVVVATHLLLSAVVRLRKRTWAGYAAVASLACLLHEFAILAVAAHGVALDLGAGVGARPGWAWAQAASVVAVVLAPLVIVSQQQAALVGWISAPGPPELLGFGALALTGLVCARGPLPARAPSRCATSLWRC